MVCVTLSCFDILMTKQFGYLIEVYSTLCQSSGKGVEQSVVCEILNPRFLHCINKCSPEIMLVNLCSTLAVENNLTLDTYNLGFTPQDIKCSLIKWNRLWSYKNAIFTLIGQRQIYLNMKVATHGLQL